jgi:hypothetical protein
MIGRSSLRVSYLAFGVACLLSPACADDLSDCSQPSDIPADVDGCGSDRSVAAASPDHRIRLGYATDARNPPC